MKPSNKKFNLIELPDGEMEPLVIAARAAPRMAIGVSGKTFANWRSQKKGPPFVMIDGVPYYPWEKFKDHFSQGLVKTFNRGRR